MSATRSTGPSGDPETDTQATPKREVTVKSVPAAKGKSIVDAKPGSQHETLDLPHDFGARPDDTAEALYASHATLSQDPGRTQVRSNDEGGGTRQSGAGSAQGGAGSGSGGDLDADVVGIDGRGLAASIPDRKERADSIRHKDDSPVGARGDGDPAAGENQDRDHLTANDDVARGGTVTFDKDTAADGEARDAGADALRTTDADDPYADAAAGEVSTGESDPTDSSSSSSASNAER